MSTNKLPTGSRRFDLIVFDWDGTLFDSTALIARCIQWAIADVGGHAPGAQKAAYGIGLSLQQALAHAAPDVAEDKRDELLARYRYHYARHQNDICLFDGVLCMLADLRERQHWLAVGTGKSRVGLNEALHAVQLQGLFDASRTADETASKPHPMMLQELMQEFGVDCARVLMVGDTTHDLEMARNAGCQSVGVSYGAHEAIEFAASKPLFIAHSVPDLHQWLLSNA